MNFEEYIRNIDNTLARLQSSYDRQEYIFVKSDIASCMEILRNTRFSMMQRKRKNLL